MSGTSAGPPVLRRIASKDNPLLVRLRKLAADPAAYRKLGELWLEGEHLGAAFVQRGGRPALALLAESREGDPALRALAGLAQETVLVADALLAGCSTLESPAPIGFVVGWRGAGALQPGAPTVVLDRLQDAGNVGNILRSAAAFGFTQVVALKGSVALWSPKVLRAGMGAHFALNLVESADAAALETLAVPLLATSSHDAEPLPSTPLPWPCAWLMGHEGQGVAPALLARCARTIGIPQPGGEESLNVAAAAAVCLYESVRQRLVGIAKEGGR